MRARGDIRRSPSAPLLFIKATSCIVAHGDDIVIPAIAPDQVDYEAELVVVIGRAAKNVSIEDACACSGAPAARRIGPRLPAGRRPVARAKSFDTFGPVGPRCDGLDTSALRVRMLLNGETMQDQSTGDMVFDVPYPSAT